MPASLFHDSDHQTTATTATTTPGSNTLEEQRALQLALELTMLGLMNDDDSIPNYNDVDPARAKKSQNTTECVPVPSSEHVAEIVGRQGCKIKALRAKTNTYIKTPVRGEEPVFVVTGRKEDVSAAKREILSAAEHFSQIRAQRKNNLNGSINGVGPNANLPGQTTIQVRVPYRVVGLVVGPKGATIKRIQQQTNTYIITPSRDKEPTFEVTGLPENVETARKEIEAHIAIRTGGIIDSTAGSSSHSSSDSDSGAQDFTTTSSSPLFNGMDNPFSPTTNGLFKNANTDPFTNFTTNTNTLGLVDDLLSPQSQDIFSFNLNGGVNSNNNNNNNSNNTSNSNTMNNNNNTNSININNKINSGVGKLSDLYSTFNGSGFTYGFNNFYERDEGIGDSPTFDSIGATLAANQALSNTVSSLWPDFISSTTSTSTTNTSLSAAPQRPFPSTVSPLGRRNSGIGSQNSP